MDDSYPLGGISFYPARDDSLVGTFPHQECSLEREEQDWTTGKLCLADWNHRLDGPGESLDPIGDAERRLCWHVERAVAWLHAAVEGKLLAPGDPFELPHVPWKQDRRFPNLHIVHDEGPEHLAGWRNLGSTLGKAEVVELSRSADILAVTRFLDWDGTATLREKEWPRAEPVDIRLFWWLWPEPVTLAPWQCPSTWGEVRQAGERLGVDVDSTLRKIFGRLGEKKHAYLLIGYPIPEKVGDSAKEIHWQAITLPNVNLKKVPGFRDQMSLGRWTQARRDQLADSSEIEFIMTSNWHPDRLQARGRYPQSLREAKIVLLGVGALGSALAELLVRGGARDLALVDPENLVAGNLARHVLTLEAVGDRKAETLARRLEAIWPDLTVHAEARALPLEREATKKFLEPYDLVIDCTASEEVPAALAAPQWSLPKRFVSCFLGDRGRKLFVFSARGFTFPRDDLVERYRPWWPKRSSEEAEPLLEGPGCWSPLSPARADDVWLAAAAASKRLAAVVEQPIGSTELFVLEQVDSNGFNGYRRLDSPGSAP